MVICRSIVLNCQFLLFFLERTGVNIAKLSSNRKFKWILSRFIKRLRERCSTLWRYHFINKRYHYPGVFSQAKIFIIIIILNSFFLLHTNKRNPCCLNTVPITTLSWKHVSTKRDAKWPCTPKLILANAFSQNINLWNVYFKQVPPTWLSSAGEWCPAGMSGSFSLVTFQQVAVVSEDHLLE